MANEFELLQVLTHAELYRLQLRYASGRLYIPLTLPPGHRLIEILGPGAAKKLQEKFAGELFTVSRSLLLRERNAAIRAQRAWGHPTDRVARAYGLTTRSVRKICQGQPPPNFYGSRRRRARATQLGAAHDRTHRVPADPHG